MTLEDSQSSSLGHSSLLSGLMTQHCICVFVDNNLYIADTSYYLHLNILSRTSELYQSVFLYISVALKLTLLWLLCCFTAVSNHTTLHTMFWDVHWPCSQQQQQQHCSSEVCLRFDCQIYASVSHFYDQDNSELQCSGF